MTLHESEDNAERFGERLEQSDRERLVWPYWVGGVAAPVSTALAILQPGELSRQRRGTPKSTGPSTHFSAN